MDRIHSSRVAYLGVAWGVVLAVLVQVSLIGLWLFAYQPTMYLHKELGHAITLMIIALLILAFTGRLPATMRLMTVALSAISVVQTEVFAFIPGSPLRAFHPVLALVIFSLATLLASRALPVVRERPTAPIFPISIGKSDRIEGLGSPRPGIRKGA